MTNELSTERAIEALYTVRAYYASLTAGYPKGKDCRGIGDVMCSEIANSCLMAINALEIVNDFETAQIITGGRLNGRAYAYKCGLADGQRLAKSEKIFNILPLEQQPSEDCIRREAVMKCFKKWQPYMATRLWDYEQELKDLPSVTPQPSEDWYDVPSDEMTLEQARQAVKNLRKKLAEHLEQQPNRCDSCVHSEEQDGSNCYECVKGMTDNFETRSTDADCISRQMVNELVDELARAISDERCCISRGRSTATIMQDILNLPSVTPQPKVGKWIAQDIHNCHTDFKCSECGYIHSFTHLYGEPTADYTYCPRCGAKMEVAE